MLIYIVSAALCCLYAAETILTAHNLRAYTSNPPSSKLLVLAEACKLVLASSFFLCEERVSNEPGFFFWRKTLDNRWWCPSKKLLSEGKAMMVFAVPAVCYFVTNNLAFYALQLMPAHSYILLSDLRVITTCILSYLVLKKTLNRRAMLSMVLLFAGICTGHWATMPAGADDSSSQSQLAASQAEAGRQQELQQWLQGALVMLVYSLLSAVAAVYLEWIMSYSPTYRHESLNLQNVRLYISGTLLNGLYCYAHAGGAAMRSLDDLMSTHWAVVVLLACMGLVTSLVIKRYGNIVKVYASCIASLFAAGVSHTLFHQPPPTAFYMGCSMAMVATLQLQKARAADATVIITDDIKVKSKYDNHKNNSTAYWVQLLQQSRGSKWLAVTILGLSSLIGITLVLRMGSDWCNGQATYTTTILQDQDWHEEAAVSKLVPYEPTCFTEEPHMMGCPVLDCSQDSSCSIHNTSCCAYFNYEMLRFFQSYMASKCLQDEYQIVYGTALGALRNQSILGHTQDLDLGITPLGLQFLELNSTRRELWQHGYSFWFHQVRGVWKLCPHLHHPSPHFQALMLQNITKASWERTRRLLVAVYTDFWLMWPVSHDVSDCRKSPGVSLQQQLATPWDGRFLTGQPDSERDEAMSATVRSGGVVLRQAARSALRQEASSSMPAGTVAGDPTLDTCSGHSSKQDGTADADGNRWGKYCIAEGALPLVVVAGSSRGKIGNLTLPMANNTEELMTSTYGPGWRSPHTSYHGKSYVSRWARKAQQALVEKLSVTAWGSMPYDLRRKRCRKKWFTWAASPAA